MDVWLSNHFPCQDLVQHPMETTIENCDVWSSRLDRSVVQGAPNVLQHQIQSKLSYAVTHSRLFHCFQLTRFQSFQLVCNPQGFKRSQQQQIFRENLRAMGSRKSPQLLNGRPSSKYRWRAPYLQDGIAPKKCCTTRSDGLLQLHSRTFGSSDFFLLVWIPVLWIPRIPLSNSPVQ